MERALDVRRCLHFSGFVSDDQLHKTLRRHKINVISHAFRGNIAEALIGRRIWLHSGLERAAQRWLLVHAFGHYLLHRGDHLERPDMVIVAKQEHQAEEFAGWLFLADSWARMPAWELAEYHCLPQERVERWLGLICGEAAVSAGW